MGNPVEEFSVGRVSFCPADSVRAFWQKLMFFMSCFMVQYHMYVKVAGVCVGLCPSVCLALMWCPPSGPCSCFVWLSFGLDWLLFAVFLPSSGLCLWVDNSASLRLMCYHCVSSDFVLVCSLKREMVDLVDIEGVSVRVLFSGMMFWIMARIQFLQTSWCFRFGLLQLDFFNSQLPCIFDMAVALVFRVDSSWARLLLRLCISRSLC